MKHPPDECRDLALAIIGPNIEGHAAAGSLRINVEQITSTMKVVNVEWEQFDQDADGQVKIDPLTDRATTTQMHTHITVQTTTTEAWNA